MKKGILYFHGFPGPASKVEPGTVFFTDKLQELCNESNHDLLAPHYPGISDGTEFSFIQALEYAKDYLAQKLEAYDELTLMGRSFGGLSLLYALNSLESSQNKVKSIVFVTPLVKMPPAKDAKLILVDTEAKAPGLLKKERTDFYLDEIQKLSESFDPFQIYHDKKLNPTPIHIGAKDDVITPAKVIKLFAEHTNAKYLEIEGEHDLGDKEIIAQTLRDLLN